MHVTARARLAGMLVFVPEWWLAGHFRPAAVCLPLITADRFTFHLDTF